MSGLKANITVAVLTLLGLVVFAFFREPALKSSDARTESASPTPRIDEQQHQKTNQPRDASAANPVLPNGSTTSTETTAPLVIAPRDFAAENPYERLAVEGLKQADEPPPLDEQNPYHQLLMQHDSRRLNGDSRR